MGRKEMSYGHPAAADKSFARRVNQVMRRHSRLSKGYLLTVGHDGLVVARPRRLGLRFPLRGLLLAFLTVVGFKAFAFAWLGESGYHERLSALGQGTTAEKLAAWVMQPDPLARTVASAIASYLD